MGFLQTLRAYLPRPFLLSSLPESVFMPESDPLRACCSVIASAVCNSELTRLLTGNVNDRIHWVLSPMQVLTSEISETFDGLQKSSDLDILERCLVKSVDHRKATSGSFHESIHITMQVTGAASKHIYTRHLELQRTPLKDGTIEQRIDMKAKNGRVPAQDTIQISTQPDTEGTFSVHTMTFPHHTPNILHLISMCMAIISIAPEYRLYTYSCYWFARMVFEGLHYRFHGLDVPDPQHHMSRGAYLGFWKVVAVDEECRFILNSESEKEVKQKKKVVEDAPELQYQPPCEPISEVNTDFVTVSDADHPPAQTAMRAPPSAVTAMLKRYDPIVSAMLKTLKQNQETRLASKVCIVCHTYIWLSSF